MARALLVAFSCCPGLGSEAGIGWNFAMGMSQYHDITLLTTSEFQPEIDAYLRARPNPRLRVIYRDGLLPRRVMFKSYTTANIYYYLWQLRIGVFVRGLQRRERFDLIHHVNWGRYWMTSGAAFGAAPFVWGPVGAAEGAPHTMHIGMSLRGRTSEITRDFMRWLFERDPLTMLTARRAHCAIAATHETAAKLREWGVADVAVIPSVGVAPEDLPIQQDDAPCRYDFISIGRLLDWKGFHFGLRAFARANIPGTRYAIVGEGPEEQRLRRLARELRIDSRVDFLGHISRPDCLRTLTQSRMLVHPSLHDSGGFVLVEAMALGKPVICLRIGGPAVIVDDHSGIRIEADNSEQTVERLVQAMTLLHRDRPTYDRLSRGARERGNSEFLWSRKMRQMDEIYRRVLAASIEHGASGAAPAASLVRFTSGSNAGRPIDRSRKKSADAAA